MGNEKVYEIEIRRMKGPAEAEFCARIMADSEPWITLKRDFSTLHRIVGNPAREVYLAEMERKPAGFIMLNMQGAFVGYVQSICVAPEWRNKGIGKRLLEFAEKRIFEETPNVFICVSSFNPDALRLYDRLGYAYVGELKDFIVKGHSEFLLRKTIAPLCEFQGK